MLIGTDNLLLNVNDMEVVRYYEVGNTMFLEIIMQSGYAHSFMKEQAESLKKKIWEEAEFVTIF